MSEENISSAFSFSDLLGLTLTEKSKNDKLIKTWKTNTSGDIQFENKEKQIAIQEEYETYGTERKKRLVKRTFYKKPDGKSIAYS